MLYVYFSKYLINANCSVDEFLYRKNNDKIQFLRFDQLRNDATTYD